MTWKPKVETFQIIAESTPINNRLNIHMEIYTLCIREFCTWDIICRINPSLHRPLRQTESHTDRCVWIWSESLGRVMASTLQLKCKRCGFESCSRRYISQTIRFHSYEAVCSTFYVCPQVIIACGLCCNMGGLLEFYILATFKVISG